MVVPDMEASVDWYQRVLGFEPAGEVREGPPEARHPRTLLKHPGKRLVLGVLGVLEPIERSGDEFDPPPHRPRSFSPSQSPTVPLWMSGRLDCGGERRALTGPRRRVCGVHLGVRPGRNPVGAVGGETV